MRQVSIMIRLWKLALLFKTVQNKIHWAITGQTEAEIIHQRTNSEQKNMGLTNWRGSENGKAVRKADVVIAKNYLKKEELSSLNNLTEQYLVFAEGQAMRRIPMNMTSWVKKLNGFLTLNDRDILDHAGKISHNMAKELAELEYGKFKQSQLKIAADKAEQQDLTQLEIIAQQAKKTGGRS